MRRAEPLRHREFAFELVDRDDLARAGDPRALDCREADAARAEHRDGRAGLDFGGVQHRADAGGDAASDQRGAIERDVLADFHQCVLMQQHLLAVGRNVEELIDWLALLRDARLVAGPRCVAALLAHRFGCPDMHCSQYPQNTDRHAMTWSPGFT